jgi:hypothetical protein
MIKGKKILSICENTTYAAVFGTIELIGKGKRARRKFGAKFTEFPLWVAVENNGGVDLVPAIQVKGKDGLDGGFDIGTNVRGYLGTENLDQLEKNKAKWIKLAEKVFEDEEEELDAPPDDDDDEDDADEDADDDVDSDDDDDADEDADDDDDADEDADDDDDAEEDADDDDDAEEDVVEVVEKPKRKPAKGKPKGGSRVV